MRVISGKYKSRKLCSIKDSSNLRPTTDRVKETIFDIISNYISFENINFLDLFSGTGAIGVEAISRGAKKTYFVENNKKNLKILQKNIEVLNINKKKYSIISKNVNYFFKNFNDKIFFDVIFADPPYNKGFVNNVLLLINNFKNISNENLIIVEHNKNEIISDTIFKKEFLFVKERIVSDIKISFLKKIKNYLKKK